MMQTYRASAKLMLFGEYLVLRGSKSLAIPLKYGQSLQVTENESGTIHWRSFEADDLWFEATFSLNCEILSCNDRKKAEQAAQLMQLIQMQKPLTAGYDLQFQIDFDRQWGLGTSSTLLSLLSQWSGVDAYRLLEKSFGGSGYDIACATAAGPITYEMKNRRVEEVDLAPSITNHLLFVYTGKKQVSSREVGRFADLKVEEAEITEMSQIVEQAALTTDLEQWEDLMARSEELLSGILGIAQVGEQFPDYPYAIKSLGAWGGDFIMVTFRDIEKAKGYFSAKGLTHFAEYRHMIKKP